MSKWFKYCMISLIAFNILLAVIVTTVQVIRQGVPLAEVCIALLIISATAWLTYQDRSLGARIADLEARQAIKSTARRMNSVD